MRRGAGDSFFDNTVSPIALRVITKPSLLILMPASGTPSLFYEECPLLSIRNKPSNGKKKQGMQGFKTDKIRNPKLKNQGCHAQPISKYIECN